MKIKCIKEKITPGMDGKKLVEWANNSELEITLGKTYVVLAISKYSDIIFYYIIGDEAINYPLAFPFELFQIIDNNVSKYWKTDLIKIDSLGELDLENGEIISFKEWVLKKDEFYEKVLEEMQPEVSIFNAYRDKMLSE